MRRLLFLGTLFMVVLSCIRAAQAWQPANPDAIESIAWSPDGNLIASGASDGWVRLWNPSSGQITFEFKGTDSEIDEWNVSEIQIVFFSPDGNSVSSISADGTFRTRSVSTGTTLETVQLLNFPVYAASLSPDGTQVAYGGEDGTLQFISVPTPPNGLQHNEPHEL